MADRVGSAVMEIRHAQPADYGRVISRVNTWWGGREMAPMLPRLFFVHFEGTSYVVDGEDGQLAAFLIGFHSQSASDEAYIHFAENPSYPTMIPATKDYENVLVARTFSKAYGLGGARVGYGVANKELLKKLGLFGIGRLNKNALSVGAALGALEDPEHVARTVEVVREGKKYLYKELESMGYQPIRTQTIFVTVEIGSFSVGGEFVVNR